MTTQEPATLLNDFHPQTNHSDDVNFSLQYTASPSDTGGENDSADMPLGIVGPNFIFGEPTPGQVTTFLLSDRIQLWSIDLADLGDIGKYNMQMLIHDETLALLSDVTFTRIGEPSELAGFRFPDDRSSRREVLAASSILAFLGWGRVAEVIVNPVALFVLGILIGLVGLTIAGHRYLRERRYNRSRYFRLLR